MASNAAQPGQVGRLVAKLRNDGAKATAARAVEVIKPRVHVNERHVWYSMTLPPPPATRPLQEGLTLKPGTAAELPLLNDFDTIGPEDGQARLNEGTAWWLVLDDQQPLFSCWIFTGRTPVLAAPGGWLQLPDRTAVLEDSVTTPAARGRGIAPAAWSEIANVTARSADTLLTKVAVDNAPSRKAVVKAGFAEVGTMQYRRVLLVGTTSLHDVAPEGQWLSSPLGADQRMRLLRNSA